MRLTDETKLFLGLIIATVVIVAVGIFFLTKPAPALPREQLIPAATTTKGPATASAYLVEFSDFQCPACKSFAPIVDEITATYKDKLLFAYRHFPLDQHQFAVKTALASEAANEQGKFWEMYRYLFDNQEKFTDELIAAAGKEVKLDEKKYTEALRSEKYKDKVFKDLADGKKFGVNATPTFFLNGIKLNLPAPQDLRRAVDAAIAGIK